ncbi:EcsC family protein [Spirosoma luteolum]
MSSYEESVRTELMRWQQRMQQPPTRLGRTSALLQRRINKLIPARIHQLITAAIKQMTRAMLFGAEALNRPPAVGLTLPQRETKAIARIDFYKRAGAVEGGATGAGGLLLGLADFPLLMGIKMKLLFELAAIYGYTTSDYRERVYMLSVFQLAFSSQERRQQVYTQLANWPEHSRQLPADIHQFDWLTFQQEYRDYIDLVKLAQFIPGIGAAVGLVANYQLIDQLGQTAMNAYRMRWLDEGIYRP